MQPINPNGKFGSGIRWKLRNDQVARTLWHKEMSSDSEHPRRLILGSYKLKRERESERNKNVQMQLERHKSYEINLGQKGFARPSTGGTECRGPVVILSEQVLTQCGRPAVIHAMHAISSAAVHENANFGH